MYYTFMGVFTVLIVGLAVSFLTGAHDPKDIDPNLISPVVKRFFKDYSKQDAAEVTLLQPVEVRDTANRNYVSFFITEFFFIYLLKQHFTNRI